MRRYCNAEMIVQQRDGCGTSKAWLSFIVGKCAMEAVGREVRHGLLRRVCHIIV